MFMRIFQEMRIDANTDLTLSEISREAAPNVPDMTFIDARLSLPLFLFHFRELPFHTPIRQCVPCWVDGLK